MNFIKKKLKSHKKDDEEEEYEKAVYEQSLRTGDQNVKNTEEWQFFQQLSMKVQDTMQKTQTTLNKLKDIRQDSKEDFDFGSETTPDFSTEDSSPFGPGKNIRAPPRPPPPAADKAWFPVEVGAGSDLGVSFPSKGPARPPPPPNRKETSQISLLSDSSALQDKSFPNASLSSSEITGMQFNQMPLSGSGCGTAQQSEKSFSLLEEFGFQTDTTPVVSSSKTDFQDLLFLDVKEEVDPFDTSFVDVTNITPQTQSVPKGVKPAELSCNPFSSTSDLLMEGFNDISNESSSNTKKTPTNPFFSEPPQETEIVKTQTTTVPFNLHNPFSDTKSSTSAVNDLFSLELLPSDQKDVLGDTSVKNEISLLDSFADDLKDLQPVSVPDMSTKLNDINLLNMEATTVLKTQSIVQTAELSNNVPEVSSMWQNLESNENSNAQILPEILSQKPRSGSQSSETSASWESNPAIRKASVISHEECITESKDVSDASPIPSEEIQISNSNKNASVGLFDNKVLNTTDKDELIGAFDSEIRVDTVKEVAENSSNLNPEPEFPDVLDDHSLDADSKESSVGFPTEEKSTDGITKIESGKNEQPLPDTAEAFASTFMDTADAFASITDTSDTFASTITNTCNEFVSTITDTSDALASTITDTSDTLTPTISDTADAFASTLTDTTDAFSSAFSDTTNAVTHTLSATDKTCEKFSESFTDENRSFNFSFKPRNAVEEPNKEFDAFSAKFESAKDNVTNGTYDPFSSGKAPMLKKIRDEALGFGSMDEFDPFKVSKAQMKKDAFIKKDVSQDSFDDYDNETDFSIVIKPQVKDLTDTTHLSTEPPKLLPPPPKTPTKAFDSSSPRFNPFDKDSVVSNEQVVHEFEKGIEASEVEEEPIPALGEAGVRKADSIETPLSPLFDEDTSMPLEEFPKPYPNDSWEMVLRQPNKKKLTGNRFWKKIIVKLSENSVLQLFNKPDDKLPFQELPLQACYSLSEIGAQQYDQYGKIFTVKLQYKFYRERVGVRPGQITKVTQGQVTSMGDVARLGLPLQHSPQTSQLLKLGTHSYVDIKYFIQEVENALFRIVVHRDRVLTYKTEEIQVIAQDEFYVEQSKTGHVEKQLARVRVFFLAFITGMPSVEVGLNDINRQGKEVVGRYDIIPVVTEEWIRLEDWEFHSCVIQEEFQKTRIIKFHPPDACLFELLRFRIRPPRNRELPLQVRVFMTVTSSRVEIRSDILVPGYSSRKQGQIPCENIQIRFPIPECWIYLFRTEKHFRYGSKKSAARRPGKIKGLERIMGAAQNLDPSLIEVSAGQAKYEHVFHAVVWRIPRLPKEGQGAYTQQLFLLRTELTAFDQIPESFEQYVDVEFTMPATYVSHTTVRSVSVSNPNPPEKYVRYISKHEYRVEIDFKSADEIDGLMSSPSANAPPVTTTAAVQESTEDEKDEDDSD